MSLRTPLHRVRGLGAAKEGVGHWWAQRVSAIALVPLLIWLVASLVFMTGAGHGEVAAWIAHPGVGVLLVLFLVAAFYHAKLGIQVVVEDYVHSRPLKLVCLLANTFGNILLGALCAFSVLKIAFQGP